MSMVDGAAAESQKEEGVVKPRIAFDPFFILLAIFYIYLLVSDGLYGHLFCDEGSFLRNVGYFGAHRTVEPVFTNYPTFYSYLIAVPIYLAYGVYYLFFSNWPLDGLLDARVFALLFQGDLDIWLRVGRSFSILCAVGILALVYRYCTVRLNRLARLVVLALLVISPYSFYMTHARYALPDIVVAFLVTSILFMAFRYIEKPDTTVLYCAGMLAGLAAGAKLNGVLAVAPLLALPLIMPSRRGQQLKVMALILACAILGFGVGSPFNVLKPGLYSSGFGLESDLLYRHYNDLNFQWLVETLWQESPGMTVLVLAAIVFSLWRHAPQDKVFHALLIPSVIFLGGLGKRMPHYLLFLFPWLCILVGEFVQEIMKWPRWRILRWVLIALVAGIVVYESYQLAGRVRHNSQPDNFIVAQAWIRENMPADTSILLDWGAAPMGFLDLAVMPPDEYINKNKYSGLALAYVHRRMHGRFGYLPAFNFSLEDLRAQGWRYFMTDSECFSPYLRDPSRLDAVAGGSQKAFRDYLWRRAFYLRLFQESTAVKIFRAGSGPAIYIFQLTQ